MKVYRLLIIFVILLTSIYSIVSFHVFQSSLRHSLFEESHERLDKSGQQTIVSLQQSFKEYNDRLETIAILCTGNASGEWDQEIIQTIQELSAIQENVWYELFDMDGNVYTMQGGIRQMLDQDLFKTIQNNEHYISAVSTQNTFGRPAIEMAVPIIQDQVVVGGVIGTFYVDYFTEILAKSLYDGIGATMIMQADGTMVSSYEGMEKYDDFYSMLEQFAFPDRQYDLETFKNNVQEQKSGFILYEYNGIHRYASYQPIGIRDWYVINLVMADSLSPRFNEITMNSVLFALSNAGMITLLLIVLFIYWRKVKHQSQEQQNFERFQIITSMQDKEVIFEYDLRYKTIHFSDNFQRTFHRTAPVRIDEDMLKQVIFNHDVLPQLESIKKDGKRIETDVLLECQEGTSLWFKLQADVLYDKKKQPERVIGFLMNIDEEKREQNRLIQRVELDDLTGVYNRDVLREQFISITQQPNTTCALLFIDIDNFKAVNDTYGHLCGDHVLSRIAQLLKATAGDKGMTARYGGDEFVILLYDLKACSLLKEFADSILNSCQDQNLYNCTLSIGIACYPEHATTYNNLIACADEALYQAKSNGKHQYQIYHK